MHWPPVVAVTTLAHLAGVRLQPVMSEAHFPFPEKSFYSELAQSGAPIGESVEVAEARLKACFASETDMMVTQASEALRVLFRQ
ncbi:MAG: hypothetical protein SGPRY_006708, partial [Prymnesium sp.]